MSGGTSIAKRVARGLASLAFLVCLAPFVDGDHDVSPTINRQSLGDDGWRRTALGWERIQDWQSISETPVSAGEPFDDRPTCFPLAGGVVALGLLGLLMRLRRSAESRYRHSKVSHATGEGLF